MSDTEEIMRSQLDDMSFKRWKKIHDRVLSVQKRMDDNSAKGRVLIKESNAVMKEMQAFFKRRPK